MKFEPNYLITKVHFMKKSILGILMGAALLVVGCRASADLEKKVDDLEKAFTEYKTQMNGQIDGLKKLVEAQASKLTITKYEQLSDKSGWTITFSDNTAITILNGQPGPEGPEGPAGPSGDPGQPGASPEITVDLNDGVYCWKVNGEWLTGTDGKPVPVTGQPVVPQFRINDGQWEVSVDNGATWKACGSAVSEGDTLFATVTPDEEKGIVTFVLKDGTTFVIPLERPFALVFPKYKDIGIEPGATIDLEYTVTGADETTVVDVMAVTANYIAEVEAESPAKGVVKVTAPDPIAPGRVLVWADNGKGKASIKALTFEGGEAPTYEITVGDADAVEPDGETIEVAVTSNMVYEVEVKGSWIHYIGTKAAETKTLLFEFDANETGEARTGEVDIVGAEGTVYQTIIFTQAPMPDVEIPYTFKADDEWFATLPAADGTVMAAKGDWNRSVAITDKYVFMPRAKGGSTDIFYFPFKNPTAVKALDMTGVEGGTHTITGCQAVKNGDGYIFLANNLATNDTQTFTVYAWDDVNSKPRVVLAFKWDGGGLRLGDRLTFNGTWQDGEIIGVNYFNYHQSYIFKVKDGVVDQTPVVTDNLNVPDDIIAINGKTFNSTICSELVRYTADEYILTANVYTYLPTIFTRADDNFKLSAIWQAGYPGQTAIVDEVEVPLLKGVANARFFELGGTTYFAFTTWRAAYTQLDVWAIALDPSKTLAENLAGKSFYDARIVATLGTDEGANPNGNGTSGFDVVVVDDTAYLVAAATNNEIGVYALNVAEGNVIGPGDATVVPGGDF